MLRVKHSVVGLVFSLASAFYGVAAQGQEQPRPYIGEVKFADMPVVVGLFDHLDQDTRMLYVGLDKDRKKLEEVELSRIRAVYLIQGNKDKLFNYLVGGAGGGAAGLSGLFMRNKFLLDKSATGPTPLEPGEAALWTSVGAGIGLVVGWLRGRGVEDIRAFPIFDAETITDPEVGKRDLRDQKNLGRIIPGMMIQVVMGLPKV